MARILAVMGCEIGSMHLLDDSKTMLNLAVWQGTPAEVIPQIQAMPLGHGVAGRVIADGGPLVVPAIEMEANSVPAAVQILAGHAYVRATLSRRPGA